LDSAEEKMLYSISPKSECLAESRFRENSRENILHISVFWGRIQIFAKIEKPAHNLANKCVAKIFSKTFTQENV
jgi:hypothetical protein